MYGVHRAESYQGFKDVHWAWGDYTVEWARKHKNHTVSQGCVSAWLMSRLLVYLFFNCSYNIVKPRLQRQDNVSV